MSVRAASMLPRGVDSTGKLAGSGLRVAGGWPAAAMAFAAGVALLQQQATVPGLPWSYALLAGAYANLLAARAEGRAPALAAWLWLPIVAAAGFLMAALWADARLSDRLDPALEGRDVRITGVVAELPHATERGTRFVFDIEQAATPSAGLPRRVSLTWYAGEQHAAGPPRLQPGQRWQVTVRLRKPHGTANPHGFDFEVWLLERGIRATGYVRAQAPARLLAPMVHRPGYWIERMRGAARDRIESALPGHPQAGVLSALAIGDQQAIGAQQWAVFTRTGVNHLMSISGLHITMIAALAFGVVVRLWPCMGAAALHAPARSAAALAGLGTGLGYALLAGFGVPAQRTVIMLAVVALALAGGRPSRGADVLAVALLAVLLLDPWAILAPGFWLSFGAVALILYVSAGRLDRSGTLRNWVHVQWALTLGLVPLLLGLFQQVSVVSPLANAVAVPVVSLGVVPLTLIGTVLPLDVALAVAAWLMGWCHAFLAALNELPAAVWQQQAPPAWALLAAVLGVLWLLAPRGFPARWIGIVALLPLFLLPAAAPKPGEYWADVLDVGQGLAVVIRTHQHALLFDAGPAFSRDADSGSRIVVPHLRATGVRRLDGLVISHDDTDHTGGMQAILEALPVGWVRSPLDPDDARLHLAQPALRCERGTGWEWDEVRFALLHPAAESYNRAGIQDNDRSCVLRVDSPAGSVLVAADIEQDAEAQLLEHGATALRSDVLIVPHHGSRTSSTDAFLRAVAPSLAVFTVGYRNRFGHPAADVLERYARRGSRILRSDADGAVLLRFEAGVSVQAWRHARPRYWHGA
jgi:competence protein ComEC